MMGQKQINYGRGSGENESSGTVLDIATGEPKEGSKHREETSVTLSKDEMFDVLRNSRRRVVITSLRTQGGSMSVEELSTRVAADEYDIPAEEISPKQYKRVYTGLYQCHLRRMEELGVIEFDTDENTVRLCAVATDLDPYLDDVPSPTIARVELGVASVVAVSIALGSVGIGPLGLVSQTALAAILVVSLVGLSLFQLLA